MLFETLFIRRLWNCPECENEKRESKFPLIYFLLMIHWYLQAAFRNGRKSKETIEPWTELQMNYLNEDFLWKAEPTTDWKI